MSQAPGGADRGWTVFAGFSLLTQGVGAISFGGEDDAAERVIGAHMLLLAAVYGLLAWRRGAYRLLLWIPFGAQLAVIIPIVWERSFDDGALLFVVALIFLVLLTYVWWASRTIGPEADDDETALWGEDDDEYEEADATPAEPRPDRTGRRYRRM
jgi:hypothetical protein